MRTAHDITFIVLSAIVTLLIVGNTLFSALADDYEIPSRSYLEGRTYQKVPEVSAKLLASGKFQSQSEQFLADRFPKRDGVVVHNAEMQRMAIELANLPFNHSAYSTFYGSKYVYIPQWESIQDIPFSQRDYPSKMVEASAEKWAAFISAHSDSRWCLAMADRAYTSASSPVNSLIGEPADYRYFQERFSNALPESCVVLDLSYSDTEAYYSDYFHTDHHWQVQGAAKAYRQILTELNRTPKEFNSFERAFNGPFFGSGVRRGLAPIASDVVFDVSYNVGSYSVRAEGKDIPRSDVDESLSDSFKGYHKPAKYANVYADYFHNDYGLLEFSNDDAPEGTLLIIGDSYTNCMDRFFAENYQHVSVVDPRYFKNELNAYINTLSPDDIVVLMGANNFVDKGVLERLG